MKPPAQGLRGFGLIQRDRNFDHYQDLETRQDRRPSLWIEPRGSWGPGKVELVEIPVQKEFNDNVVAYWVPEQQAPAGTAFRFQYGLDWYEDEPTRPPAGFALATRVDRGTYEGAVRVSIDFAGANFRRLSADAVLEGVVWVDEARAELDVDDAVPCDELGRPA